ncbi:prolyl-tRNA synthetase [Dictyostelium discoideum AX4]|uniref:proline--tRNA ligase n=1 Tax=Dictyostelium discoideum TaxID=44689 RepID=Q75JK9_DICDI|nr:prolyl-tRNA synthetase [Dictyostelium discoideum AX4]EAL69339.1 prolyl-tRNA synthetase [Dictyostelium discoideum AX4]|eukprot:XP_643312.1 prolyl-tRNA synthetase [Dictyostelium discoideum AX4]
MISLIKKSNKNLISNTSLNLINRFTTTTPTPTTSTSNNNEIIKSNKFINIFRSNLFIPFQNDQKIGSDMLESQLLMQKGGLIRRLSAGTYSTLPLAQKVMENIIKIIDEEMEKVGGQKMSMPKMLPRELWEKTGRWDSAGDDLIKLKDRKGEEYCLAPTHEEVITTIVANESLSNSSFPIKLYQIGEKYRDEVRPRFGLLRGREFTMKDMYSFDTSKEAAEITYYQVKQAYHNILERLELPYACVEADSGNIGGNMSHEFQVLANVGEDSLIYCKNCNYHANIEKAKGLPSTNIKNLKKQKSILNKQINQEINNNNTNDNQEINIKIKEIENEIKNFKNIKLSIMKITTLPSNSDKEIEEIALIINKLNDNFNQYSIKPNYNDIKQTQVLSPEEYKKYRSIIMKGIESKNVDNNSDKLLSFEEIIKHKLFIDGSVEFDEESIYKPLKSLLKKLLKRDLSRKDDLILSMNRGQNFREAIKGDLCVQPVCDGKSLLDTKRGIEVGHIFYLGTKYSSKLGAYYTGAAQQRIPLEMGCFGIGVSRLLATIVETFSKEETGFIWPQQVAPYQIIIVPKHLKSQLSLAESVSEQLQTEIPYLKSRIIIEDRSKAHFAQKVLESKFMGIPYFLVIDNNNKSIELGESSTKVNSFKIEYKSETPTLIQNQFDLINYFKNKFN